MNQEHKLLLEDDPKLFMDIVLNDDPRARMYGLHTFDDAVVCEILRHGIRNDFSELPALVQFYNSYLLPSPVERRKEIYAHVKNIVPLLGGHTAPAFNPFMMLDTDTGIVSTATVDYASIGKLIENDPMTRPRDAMDMVANASPRNPAAIVGGLLCLGDHRVCALVTPMRRALDIAQVKIVSNCYTGYTHRCVVEFYLDWLDETLSNQNEDSQASFGHIAAGLYRLAFGDGDAVLDGPRPFPFDYEELLSGRRKIDPREFASSIEDRLYSIEQREAAPKVMPHVIRAFNLTPRSHQTLWSTFQRGTLHH
ncbi:hypothetical protein J2X72_001074 [Phyllobacterium sp. 1468]|uniref:hypothetical protein n=1 Tax=Phyllobacterium sp. 1468 TaxID=2817759 RepID=UPI002855F74B|nr:hypothetical protein [Phyllobacterium sp. 1468]MDR6632303.1 hypothetical protein [Phyllobacterium sp. 1468]